MNIEILQHAGLTPGETKVYLALLEIGQSATGPIVDKAGVSTSKTYKILKRLENKGLVSHILKSGVVNWTATNPNRILEILDDAEEEIIKKKQEIKDILPELMNKINKAKEKQQAEVFVGTKGMISVFNEETKYLIENKNDVNYVLGAAKDYPKEVYDFFNRLEDKKDHLKLKRRFLFGEDAKNSWPKIEKSKYCKVKYIPYSSIVSINIYGEKVIISIFSKEPLFFVIESKEISDSFKGYFNLLWKTAK